MKNNPEQLSALEAEKTLAVIGVRAVVSRNTEKITAAMRAKIASYDKIIAAHARALINDEIRCTWPAPPEYDPILKDLTQPLKESQVHDMIVRLPDNVQSNFTTLAHKAYGFLLAALPKNVARSYAGGSNLSIDLPTWLKFCNLLRVLDDPLQVFELVSAAALTKPQVSALQTIFPNVLSSIQAAIYGAVVDARARSTKSDPYELPYKAEQGVKTLSGMPITVPSYQSVFVAPDKENDRQQEPSQAQLSPGAESAMTSAQQLQYPKA